MCCVRLAENTGCKNYAQNCHLCTIAQICRAISSQLRHVSTIKKNLLNSNISYTRPHNMVNVSPLRAEIGWQVRGTPNICHQVLHLGFVTAPMSLNGGWPNFARCLAVFWAGTLYIHFWRLLLPNGILPGAKFTLRPSLAFSYIGSIIARHSSSGREPNITAWYRERNYRTFAPCHFQQRAPAISRGWPSPMA